MRPVGKMWEPFISSIRSGQAGNAPVCGPNFEITSVQPLVQRLHREIQLRPYRFSSDLEAYLVTSTGRVNMEGMCSGRQFPGELRAELIVKLCTANAVAIETPLYSVRSARAGGGETGCEIRRLHPPTGWVDNGIAGAINRIDNIYGCLTHGDPPSGTLRDMKVE